MKKTYILIGFLVLTLSSIVGFGTYYISSSYIALDQKAVEAAKSLLETQLTLNPIQGTDTNAISMIENALSSSISEGTQIKIVSSSSPQVATDGTITYSEDETSVTVIVKIKKRRSWATQQVTVIVPPINTTTPTPDPTPSPTPDPIPIPTPDPAPDDTIPEGALNVLNYGAKGDGVTNDTTAINSAITAAYNKGGGTVWVPSGKFMVNPDSPVALKSNVTLQLSSTATIKAMPSSNSGYQIIRVFDASNVNIYGGNIVGERYEHVGTSGEYGMGISIRGSNNIHVSDVKVSDCWGDGIYVGSTTKQNYSQNVVIEKFVSNNNRRQGMSIISVKNLIIRDGTVSNTKGTPPECGIDLEPNYVTDYMQNVLIENVTAINNNLYGVGFGYYIYQNSTIPSDVTIRNLTASGNVAGTYNNYQKYLDQYTQINVY